MIKNRTAYALLGFLKWRPMSGYDLKQAIAESVGNFWSESYGQIYPMLHRLVDSGWITKRPIKNMGKRERHLYEITASGDDALRVWLHEPINERPPRIELLLKLFFSNEIPLSVSQCHVEAARSRAIESLYRYRSIAEKIQNNNDDDLRMPFWRLTLGYGIVSTQARIDWCDRALVVLKHLDKIDGSNSQLTTTGR